MAEVRLNVNRSAPSHSRGNSTILKFKVVREIDRACESAIWKIKISWKPKNLREITRAGQSTCKIYNLGNYSWDCLSWRIHRHLIKIRTNRKCSWDYQSRRIHRQNLQFRSRSVRWRERVDSQSRKLKSREKRKFSWDDQSRLFHRHNLQFKI